jgi:hypothetical protein
MFKKTILMFIYALFLSNGVTASEELRQNFYYCNQSLKSFVHDKAKSYRSKYVDEKVWDEVKDFLIPTHHPIKRKLDSIFLASRVFYDLHTMKAAGFAPAIPQHHTQIIVTSHPKLKGYIIKAYLDVQEYHLSQPEHYFWVKRVRGATLIRNFIAKYHWQHLFKVPKKWIYLLPDEPSLPPKTLRKMFILVEEDMQIYSDPKNIKLWGSERVTKKLLTALYNIITKLGLYDCAKPPNCPFSRDGRVAFVDTQTYDRWPVAYHKLTPHLSSSNKEYWLRLIEKGQKNKSDKLL